MIADGFGLNQPAARRPATDAPEYIVHRSRARVARRCERTKRKPAPASEAGVDSVKRCDPESRAPPELCSEHVRRRSGSSSSAGSENERQKRSKKAKLKKEKKEKKGKKKKTNKCDLKDKPKKRKRSLSGSPPRKWYPTADTVRLSASVRTGAFTRMGTHVVIPIAFVLPHFCAAVARA